MSKKYIEIEKFNWFLWFMSLFTLPLILIFIIINYFVNIFGVTIGAIRIVLFPLSYVIDIINNEECLINLLNKYKAIDPYIYKIKKYVKEETK